MIQKTEGILIQESTSVLSSETEKEVAAIEMVNELVKNSRWGRASTDVWLGKWTVDWLGSSEELINSLC